MGGRGATEVEGHPPFEGPPGLDEEPDPQTGALALCLLALGGKGSGLELILRSAGPAAGGAPEGSPLSSSPRFGVCIGSSPAVRSISGGPVPGRGGRKVLGAGAC